MSAKAWLDHSHGPLQADIALRDDTDLPSGYNPRTLAWAVALQRRPELANAPPEQLAQAVLAHINSGFTYTLTPGEYGDENGRHAIDEFWLDRRQGFCEHFSAAFVVIMRALDVPARIVTGYQGADPLLQDGDMIVRNSHAHAWAEIWLEGRGWERVDPTAAVAPERIVRSRSLRPRPGFVAGAIEGLSPELMATLRSQWERVNNRWNQWVLRYSKSEQFDLLQRLGWRQPQAVGSGLPADRPRQHRQPGRRGLGLVGPPPPRSLAAPGRARGQAARHARCRSRRSRRPAALGRACAQAPGHGG